MANQVKSWEVIVSNGIWEETRIVPFSKDWAYDHESTRSSVEGMINAEWEVKEVWVHE